MGLQAEFVQGQWDKLPELLQRGDIDIVLNGYEWTPAWSQRYAASIPVRHPYELQMLVRRDDTRFRDLDVILLRRRASQAAHRRVGRFSGGKDVRERFGDQVDVILYEARRTLWGRGVGD